MLPWVASGKAGSAKARWHGNRLAGDSGRGAPRAAPLGQLWTPPVRRQETSRSSFCVPTRRDARERNVEPVSQGDRTTLPTTRDRRFCADSGRRQHSKTYRSYRVVKLVPNSTKGTDSVNGLPHGLHLNRRRGKSSITRRPKHGRSRTGVGFCEWRRDDRTPHAGQVAESLSNSTDTRRSSGPFSYPLTRRPAMSKTSASSRSAIGSMAP